MFAMLPFTSKLTYRDHIFFCSRSSPGVFTESQSQGQQLALQPQHRIERVSFSLSLIIGTAASCMGYQVHVSRSTGSNWGYPRKQMPTSMQCTSQNFYDGK